MLFSWKWDPHPPPRNANNIEHYTFVAFFSRKSDPTPIWVTETLEWPHSCLFIYLYFYDNFVIICIMHVLCASNNCVTKDNFPPSMLRWTMKVIYYLLLYISSSAHNETRKHQLFKSYVDACCVKPGNDYEWTVGRYTV